MKTRIKHDQQTSAPPKAHIVLETAEDYAVAAKRIEALETQTLNEELERELQALRKAVSDWDAKHNAVAKHAGARP